MWTNSIYTSVFSRVSANGTIRLKSKYPKINFTNSTPKSKNTTFPVVVITKLPGVETGRDLEGSFVNGIISGMQIDVITNTRQEDADYIADVCLDLMKSLRYEMTGEPYTNTQNENEYRNTSRYKRNIDYGDII